MSKFDRFEDRWGDRIELHTNFIKMEIESRWKYGGFITKDKVPKHPAGTFIFDYSKINLNNSTFSEKSWSIIWGMTFGYIQINEEATFYFDQNNTKWFEIWNSISNKCLVDRAEKREKALDYDSAIEIWEELGEIEEAARVRKLKAEQGSVKVDQTVVHGDYVDDRDTIVKDSVINRSNIGAGGDDKFTRLEKLTEMKEKGLVDDDEFKQMKKEILEK